MDLLQEKLIDNIDADEIDWDDKKYSQDLRSKCSSYLM